MTYLTTSDVESLVTLASAQLAVVNAAKQERRAALAIDRVKTTGSAFDRALERWSKAARARDAAVDALLELEAHGA